jgi:hypothetical protein
VLELTLRIIARDAERFLSEPPQGAAKVYFADDYDNPTKAPKDIEFSHKHMKGAANEGTEPMVVSFGHQVFLVRPGADWRYVATDIGRLRRLLGSMSALRAEFTQPIPATAASLPPTTHKLVRGIFWPKKKLSWPGALLT